MVPIGGSALWCIAVLWSLTGLTSLFLLLRLYTRLKVVEAYGLDDHFFNAAFAMLFLYCICITVAAHYGFGRNLAEIGSHGDITRAILWEAVGQTIVVLAVWVSKTSLALFLLRLTGRRSQRLAIVVPSATLGLVILASLLSYWFDCRPLAFLWDRSIPGGYCLAVTNYIALAAGCLSIFVDVWYAAFPWYMLWGLQMPRREKLLIQTSLSLGILAAACGVERAIQLKTLNSAEYLKETAPLIVWHAAELSTTMVCIGIPVCRPLFRDWMEKITSSTAKRRGGTSENSRTNDHLDGVYTMHTIGGSEFNKMHSRRPSRDLDLEGSNNHRRSKIVLRDDIPMASPNKVVIRSTGHTHSDLNESQESILRAESRQRARGTSLDDAEAGNGLEADAKGIRVTTAFGVENDSTS